MGILGKVWKGLKGVGKWAVDHPETINTGISFFDTRRRNKAQSRNAHEKDYSLSNLNERIDQLQNTLAEEITAVRSDIHTVATDLQQAYTAQLEALAQQVEDIRMAQTHQAKALKQMVIVYGCVTIAVAVCLVILFMK